LKGELTMSKYVAVRDSVGFRGRYWKKGTVIDISQKETGCPEIINHFREYHGEDLTDGADQDQFLPERATVRDFNEIEPEAVRPPVLQGTGETEVPLPKKRGPKPKE
jgi:hypothetical protein